jgi:hypothetical protein
MARPRTAPIDEAKWDRLPDVTVEKHATSLPPAREAWRSSTRRGYAAFATSEAAKSIRPAEVHLVVTYFDVVDRELAAWRQFDAATSPTAARGALVNAHQLHRIVVSLGREIGCSPLARRNLGVQIDKHQRPGSRLEAFRRGEDGPAPTDFMTADA